MVDSALRARSSAVRAFGSHPKGHRFETCRAHHSSFLTALVPPYNPHLIMVGGLLHCVAFTVRGIDRTRVFVRVQEFAGTDSEGIGGTFMSSETVYLTVEGKQALEAELRDLLGTRRPSIITRIQDAQADGDADDSGSHEEAKDELALIDNRVREIENILRHAAIIAAGNAGKDVVQLGSHIVVQDEAGDTLNWVIVSSVEANTRTGKISSESLVGAAMMGHRQGDIVAVQVPAGDMSYTIMQVS